MDGKTRIRRSVTSLNKPNYYGSPVTKNYGSVTHIDRFGTDLICHNLPVPPVAEYDLYLRSSNSRNYDPANLTGKTGQRLRRIVIMRREGYSWKECGEAIGIKEQNARGWAEMLPLELSPNGIGS